jgi:predicted amidophosphoribosyltransferase
VLLDNEFLHSALRGIGSLFFPDLCPCCLREGQWERCIEGWSGGVSTRFIERVPIHSIAAYDDQAMKVVLAAKERGERRAKEFLTVAISSAIDSIRSASPIDAKYFLIPIPSSTRAIRRRGEDFILGLAQRVMINLGGDLHLLPILRWKRLIRDQSELTRVERTENLVDSLEVDEVRACELLCTLGMTSRTTTRLDGEALARRDLRILLIDDVITSGSTMAAAISAISHSSLGVRSTMMGVTACYSARGL